MKNQEIYIKFLSLVHAIEGSDQLPALDHDAKKLLEVIAIKHSQGQDFTISDAMAMQHIASPATIHRKLDQLRISGLIDSAHEGTNRRTKFLKPTPQALSYFDTLGTLVQKAISLH
jgi:DNA-binding MarR family transcriptional regulator